MNKTSMILMSAALVCALAGAGCEEKHEVKTPVYMSGLPADTLSAAPFKEVFPRQYASYRQNDESQVMTEYKGSVPFQKHSSEPLPRGFAKNQPYLKNLWLGYPFSYEYNEARGHTYAVHDILEIELQDASHFPMGEGRG